MPGLNHDFAGTWAPFFRALDKPIAIACLRLWTFLPDLPLLSVPCLRSCMAFFTSFLAFEPYLVAMVISGCEWHSHLIARLHKLYTDLEDLPGPLVPRFSNRKVLGQTGK